MAYTGFVEWSYPEREREQARYHECNPSDCVSVRLDGTKMPECGNNFDSKGVYEYYCRIHGKEMCGTSR